jgi:nucleoside-diphosphate-sugar epimerase
LRQFCYVPDLCKLVLYTLVRPKFEVVALVPAEEYSIGELAEAVAEEFGLGGVEFDCSKPDGQQRKNMGNETLSEWLPGFKFTTLK